MRKVKYLGYDGDRSLGYNDELTPGKIYNVFSSDYTYNSISLKNDLGERKYFYINGFTMGVAITKAILFEDVTLEYNRTKTITEILL